MPKDPENEHPEEIDTKLSEYSDSSKIMKLINKNRIPLLIALLGIILTGFGAFLYLNTDIFKSDKIEIISGPSEAVGTTSEIIVEIAGAVEKPGVYKLTEGSRVEDLLITCGGLSASADRNWVEKYLNRASKLVDSQKVYILSVDETSSLVEDKQTAVTSAKSESGYQTVSPVLGVANGLFVNLNTATFEELDNLPGIGQVYGRKIIEQRPYSNIGDLLSRGIIPSNTYEKIKDRISVY